MIMSKKYSYEEVKLCIENLGYKLLSKEYKNTSDKLVVETKDGYKCVISYTDIRLGKKPSAFYKNNPFTIENIFHWLRLNNKTFTLLSEDYISMYKPLFWKCNKCGSIWDMPFGNIYYKNQNCPYCVNQRINYNNSLLFNNPELCKEWNYERNKITPDKYAPYSTKKVWWKCSKDPKHEWQAKISDRNGRNNGCPFCSGRCATDDNNLLIHNSELCNEWDYCKNKKPPSSYLPNSHDSVWWICSKCGYNWKARISSRNNGNGCPRCSKSKGEKRIEKWLNEKKIPFISQFSFSDLRGLNNGLLKFDVAIFENETKNELKLLIEYDGEQHYICKEGWINKEYFEELQHHDKLKNEYCNIKNIKLLRIPYWEFDNIEKILDKELESAY